MQEPASPPNSSAGSSPRALPWLLLLPAACLALPGPLSPLRDDPYPNLAGSALVLTALAPAALWMAWRGAVRPAGLGLLALHLALSLGVTWFRAPVDGAAARLACATQTGWIVLCLGGASLDELGRRTFNRGLVVLSVTWTATALLGARLGDSAELAGVLGNTGWLSQAALPGAAVGAWYVATRTGAFRVLGAVAFALFLTHAGSSPVIAGALALLLTLVLSAVRSPWSRGRAKVRKRLGLMAALVAFCTVALVGGDGGAKAEDPSTAQAAAPPSGLPAPSDLGGVSVRLGIWSQLPAVLAEQALLGLGPGQFHALYPPHRNLAEQERSRGGVCVRADTEVDHPHSDPLSGLFELGLLGGLTLGGFLLLAARAALRALGETDFSLIGMGAGAMALLANGLAHGPLTSNPAAAAIGWVLLGATLARGAPGGQGADGTPLARGGRTLPIVAAALLLGGAWTSWPLVGHGRALAASTLALARGELEGAHGASLRALDHLPESAPARLLHAHTAPAPLGDEERLALWLAALEVRPHSVAALTNAGLVQLRLGRVDATRALWERAQELAPTQPRLLENLARLEGLEGDPMRAGVWIERLRKLGCTVDAWSMTLGLEVLERGRWEPAADLLFGRPLAELEPEAIFAEAQAAPFSQLENGTRRVRALAHVLWARQQVELGDYDTAVRSFRQALAPTRSVQRAPSGALPARLELAAILRLAGRDAEARELLPSELAPAALKALPDWARAALSSGP